ncbi:MAG: Radical domain protein [Herminiimonas sp.]|nr:Radical domain protein [Herminiimonas sp.]
MDMNTLHPGWSKQALLDAPLDVLLDAASRERDRGHGNRISFSRKVFIPLTKLCRDVCHYCTFATTPKQGVAPYVTIEEVLEIARAGVKAGCREALFTLGDKPELRYATARDALAEMGFASTIDYLRHACNVVFSETGLLPHVNPGVMSADEIISLREFSISQGIMLESASERLCGKGEVHFGSPDKHPAVRLATIRAAGEHAVPFTSGILIGIGETREERLDALLALRTLHREFGHIQEIIVQNFRAKPGTKAALRAEPGLDDLMWTVAAARLLFGPDMNIQVPPNLTPKDYPKLIAAGINDWGGISPVTPDHVNPEAPWPQIAVLSRQTNAGGKELVERLATYPAYVLEASRWIAPALTPAVLRAIDADGFARSDSWSVGKKEVPVVQLAFVPSLSEAAAAAAAGVQSLSPSLSDARTGLVGSATNTQVSPSPLPTLRSPVSRDVSEAISRASDGAELSEAAIVALFQARGSDFEAVCEAADKLRQLTCGDTVGYVVNRNINYTNVCGYRCQFCAFSKGRHAADLRGPAYDLTGEEVARRTIEAWQRGATEVCMQGGIHPDYSGETYLQIVRSVKEAVPDMHVHAFSPLEVSQGAQSIGLSVADFLDRLKAAGLDTLPGTAAEILDDEVRRIICPDKLSTAEWLEVIEAAHRCGFKTTSTIMFGHIDHARHWARHLLALRRLQARTGGFTEFVPLPFVHMEAPLHFKGRARSGPTFRETVLMHAVSRLVLHPLITNVQTSWVKMGPAGVQACLQAGANDLGGTLMNESISRAAGTEHGQEMPPEQMDALITSIGRTPRQRTTLYGTVSEAQCRKSYGAAPLSPLIQTPAGKRATSKVIALAVE